MGMQQPRDGNLDHWLKGVFHKVDPGDGASSRLTGKDNFLLHTCRPLFCTDDTLHSLWQHTRCIFFQENNYYSNGSLLVYSMCYAIVG